MALEAGGAAGRSQGPVALMTVGVRWFWAAISTLAVVSMFLFPIYKKVPIGWIPVLIGVALALGVKRLPPRWRAIPARIVYGGNDGVWLIALCSAAVVLRAVLVAFPFEPHSDHLVYYSYAKGFAAGGNYSSRSLFFPPGQSAWLGALIWAFGDHFRALVAAQVALSVAAAPLLYFAIRDHSRAAARWAAATAALMPSIVVWSGTLGHETTVLFLEAVILLILTLGGRKKQGGDTVAWIALGLVAGITALIRPTFLVLPGLMVLTFLLARVSVSTTVRRVIVISVCMGMVVGPWTIRNYRKFGALCLVSANFGRVMLSANHPNSDGIYYNTSSVGAELDTIAKDRLQLRMAVHAIMEDPPRFLALAFKRLVYMWGTDTTVLSYVLGDEPEGVGAKLSQPLSAVIQVAWAWLATAWAIGAVRGLSGARRWFTLEYFAAAWIGFLWFTHLVLEGISRHHLNLIPLIAMVSLPAYWEWVVASPPPPAHPERALRAEAAR